MNNPQKQKLIIYQRLNVLDARSVDRAVEEFTKSGKTVTSKTASATKPPSKK